MAASSILICGLGGLGVEIAKDIILGGVKSVTLQDTKTTSWQDLSSQVSSYSLYYEIFVFIPVREELGHVKRWSTQVYAQLNEIFLNNFSLQFFLRESDVGKNRAEASLPRLVEINEYVSTTCTTEPVSTELVSKFSVVVLTDSTRHEQLEIGDFCHANNIKFICANTNGVFG